jgi:hypothetical protein
LAELLAGRLRLRVPVVAAHLGEDLVDPFGPLPDFEADQPSSYIQSALSAGAMWSSARSSVLNPGRST